MEYHDFRGADLGYIFQQTRRFPPERYTEASISYTHRETTDEDIERAMAYAHEAGTDMVMVQEYGIAWYVPIIKG